MIPEKSFDGEHIKHHKCTLPSGCNIFGLKTGKYAKGYHAKFLSTIMDRGPSHFINVAITDQ